MFHLILAFCAVASTLAEESISSNISLSWHTLVEHLPTPRYNIPVGYWDNTLFVVRGWDDSYSGRTKNITSIPIDSLLSSTIDNSLLWTVYPSWQDDDTYGGVTQVHCSTCYTQVLNLLYIVSPYFNEAGLMLIYNMAIDNPQQVAGSRYDYSLPVVASQPCVVNNGTHIFAFGGLVVGSGVSAINSTQIYDIQNDTWYLGSNMHEKKYRMICVYNEEFEIVYIFGGRTKNNTLDTLPGLYTIEVYDIMNDSFYMFPHSQVKLSNRINSAKAVLVENKYILVIGGITHSLTGHSGSIDTTEIFEIHGKFNLSLVISDVSEYNKPNSDARYGLIHYNETSFITIGGSTSDHNGFSTIEICNYNVEYRYLISTTDGDINANTTDILSTDLTSTAVNVADPSTTDVTTTITWYSTRSRFNSTANNNVTNATSNKIMSPTNSSETSPSTSMNGQEEGVVVTYITQYQDFDDLEMIVYIGGSLIIICIGILCVRSIWMHKKLADMSSSAGKHLPKGEKNDSEMILVNVQSVESPTSPNHNGQIGGENQSL